MLQVREIRQKSGKKTGLEIREKPFFPPINCQKPWGLRRKKSGKMKNFVWKSGKSQGISLLDSCSNPDFEAP
ncbi:hypothetical protein J6590_081741 [Homalodisca vitripennis]|nr:hypothetical protein J6590_081741 [Homalodisca vitripennis]